MESVNSESVCNVCNTRFTQNHLNTETHRKKLSKLLISNEFPFLSPNKKKDICKFSSTNHSIKNNLKEFNYDHIKTIDNYEFLNHMIPIVEKLIKNQRHPNVKLQLELHVEFYKLPPSNQGTNQWFNSGKASVFNKSSVSMSNLKKLVSILCNKIDIFTRSSSGWIINKLIAFKVKIAKYNPLKGSSYIPVPEKFRNPKFGLINIQNKDEFCFKWSIARHFCLDEGHLYKVSKRLRDEAEKLNFENISFPMHVKDIDKFETQNDISVNVYTLDKRLEPLRITTKKNDIVISLLLIEKEGKHHYVYMRSLSPFINKNHKERTFPCPYCLHSFYKENLLIAHQKECAIHTPVKLILPDEKIYFKNYRNVLKHPFVIYADFESTLQKIQTCQPDPSSSYTMNTQKHIPNSFCCYTKCTENKYSKMKTYTGNDAAKRFIEYIIQETKNIHNLLNVNIPFNLNTTEKQIFNDATECYVCKKPFTALDFKVRDHNHLTGQFRGPAHRLCNLKIRNPRYIPVFIHNLSHYDAHLFIKEFGTVSQSLKVIPENNEKYISFTQTITVGKYFDKKENKYKSISRDIRFLDSFRFIPSSIDNLSKNLSKNQLNNLSKEFPNEQELDLLTRKGVYPYDYIDDNSKFNLTELPIKEHFYNKLKQESISDEDYGYAKRIWKAFKCKTFKDYHELYLKVDTLLLADIFENFRETCIKNYDLDPANYFTAPGLSWDALLKYTNIELDLITDPDMLLFIEKGIRGGISTITHRYAKANNPYLKDYDKEKPNSYIMYLDANNLYGWAMSQYLPTGNFKWVEDINNLDINNIKDDNPKGYILEVDLLYPSQLHDAHNCLPLCPESIKFDSVEKLVPNLNNKQKYVVHYRNLKQCLKLGLKLDKIHRILEFDQSPWMKPYIDLNTNKRKMAQNEFEKDFYKLMNNSVFGKTMENIRKRVDVRIVKDELSLQKLVNKPNFKSFKIFTENFAACHMQRQTICFNKPIYIGMCVLDISKTLMYNYHYNHIKKDYKEKAKLLFTDTDSLCYLIHTNDFYNDMKKNLNLYDTSNYDTNHELYSNKNKKVIGLMKDEANGIPIQEFVGLRAKLYSYKLLDNEFKKAKGVSKTAINKSITIEDYKKALFEKKDIYKSMYTIQSKNHELYTNKINKVSLNGNDDKRHVLEDNINTLAIGHYKIK